MQFNTHPNTTDLVWDRRS